MNNNAHQLYQPIKQRFKPPAWVTFSEVSDGTGVNIARYADAIAMSIWPSRGYDLLGFEIKVSRSDWLKELNDPSKSWPIQRFCNAWWVVAADDDIVKDGELPPTWGLMVPKGNKLRVVRKAPNLKPERMDRAFIASILRRQYQCQEVLSRKAVENALGHRVDSNTAARQEAIDLRARVRDLECENNALRSSMADFEKVSGIQLSRWNGGNMGKLVKAFQEIPTQPKVLEWFKNAETQAHLMVTFATRQREELERLMVTMKEDSYDTLRKRDDGAGCSIPS